MLFAEEDAPRVKAWIVKRLENNSDADADVLADYVLALLRHDGDVEAIRKLFEEEIPDFLREDAAAFTDDVLRAVEYRSYLPGAPPAPPAAVTRPNLRPPRLISPALPPRPDTLPPSTSLYDPQAPFSTPSAPVPLPSKPSRKRALDDNDDDVDIILNGQSTHTPRPYKQPRRDRFSQRGGRHQDSFKSRSQRSQGPFTGSGSFPYGGPLPLLAPAIDANTIMENIQMLQSLLPAAMDLAPPAFSAPAGPPHRRQHGTQLPYASSPNPLVVDEYDPNNAALSLPPFGVPLPPAGQSFDFLNLQSPIAPNRREPKRPRRTKGRAAFAMNGPVHDKTKKTLVVQNIPTENFTEDQVRGYFSQFGDIKEVSMQNQDRLATIKFDSWESANTAWSSPKVIFDNRFVKVYWYKEEGEGGATPNGKPANVATNGKSNGATPANEPDTAEPEFDFAEFERKQQEAQKRHDEKVKKRQEIERERQELEERQKKLYERQAEAKRLLATKLRANGSQDDLSSHAENSTDGKDKKHSAQTEALRNQLAALEQEANQLGINPDDNPDDPSPWMGRGRGRGRGFRGRGMFSPRAARGGYGYRGRGGTIESRHAAYAAYSLDNRPKTVVLAGVDFTAPEKDEALRQYLFSIGEFKEVHSTQASTKVTFKDRKTAEKFMFGISANNSIHGIEGKIEATWATAAPESAKPTDDDVVMGRTQDDNGQTVQGKTGSGTTETNGELEEGEIESTPGRDQRDMDYEAGEW
ncbi:hypothetical protein F4777DRAFT_104563 [Nemania sp. FL0916]|nr:hypothetical protein F4777DRAFT_104563 [Nemania sp. FL0916]